MARHSHRSAATGRFAKVDPETDFVPDNVSGAASQYTQSQANHGPSGDQLDGPTGHRSAVIIDAASGQHLATVAQDDLRQLLGRTNGHLGEITGEHDAPGYLATGR